MGILAALFGFFAVAAGLSFLAAYIIMRLFNIVVPYFGGPHITYGVTYAAYWLVAIVSGLLNGGFSCSTKKS